MAPLEHEPDQLLAAVIGEGRIDRLAVVPEIWKYIREHGLQDPDNKRIINADDKLRPVIGGKDQVDMFELTQYLNRHLLNCLPESESTVTELTPENEVRFGQVLELISDANYEKIDEGIALMKQFNEPSIFEKLLDGCGVVENEFSSKILVHSRLYTGEEETQKFRNYALLNIIGNVPENAAPHSSLQRENITVLSLYDHCGFEKFPEGITLLDNLFELSVYNSPISNLPPSIGSMESLESLAVINCSLNEIPKEIGQLNNLLKLNLSGNRLVELPHEICQLTSLRFLSLYENNLQSLPTALSDLVDLDDGGGLSLWLNEGLTIPTEIEAFVEIKIDAEMAFEHELVFWAFENGLYEYQSDPDDIKSDEEWDDLLINVAKHPECPMKFLEVMKSSDNSTVASEALKNFDARANAVEAKNDDEADVDGIDTTEEEESAHSSSDGGLVLPSSTPDSFVSAAESIHASGQGQATTLGDVLGWFGASDRSDEAIAQLQSLLDAAKLSTFPDVATAPLDSPMELRLAQGVVAGTYTIEVEAPVALDAPAVEDDSGRESVELPSDVPAAFVEVGQAIHDTGQGHATTVRDVLSWFGAKRRGTQVVAQVEKALSAARLTSFPDVESAPMDSPMELRLGPDMGVGSVLLVVGAGTAAASEDQAESGGSEEIDRDFWSAKASPASMEAMDYLASMLGEKVGDCQLVYTKYRVHPCTVDRVCRAIYFSPQRKALMIQLRMPETADWTKRFAIPDLSGRYIEKQGSYRLNVMPEDIRKHSELWRSVLGGIWEGTIEGVEEEKGADEGLMRRVRGLFGRG